MNPTSTVAAQTAARAYGDDKAGKSDEGTNGKAEDNGEQSAGIISKATNHGKPLPLPYQKEVKVLYESNRSQMTVAGIIVINFLITCTNKWIDPSSRDYKDTWDVFNIFFNILFTVELGVNLYGRWWSMFWESCWNRFDFVVVVVGLVNMFWVDMPKSLRLIKMLRAFRVFRLFNRVKAMRKIIESLMRAVPGVLNAFLINAILVCIYAVLSVDFFGKMCLEENLQGRVIATKPTARGDKWCQEYYGDFIKALYTMFQVLTGESWSEAGARPAIDFYYEEENWLYYGITYIFFYSFVMINSFVLLNVVVAVLMDGMNSCPGEESHESKEDRVKNRLKSMQEQLSANSERFNDISRELEKLKQMKEWEF